MSQVHSGRWAVVNGVSTVRNWSINDDHAPAQGVASNTGFGTLRRKGVHDWTGSFQRFGIQPAVLPGRSFSFLGYGYPNNDISGTGQRYSGTALLTQAVVNWNWGSGELISVDSEFSGDVALSIADGAQITDGAVPDAYPIGGCYAEYSLNGTDWVTWDELVQATLTLTWAAQERVTSSTYVGGKLWKGRKPGIFDWTLAMVEANSDRTRFGKGDELWVRIHCNASGTLYWELKTGIVGPFSGIQVDRETGKINQQTVNVSMNSNLVSDGSLGHVLMPDTTALWPLS